LVVNSDKNLKKTLILSVLFLLPVVFLLFLYPSVHNYTPLEVVNENVTELSAFESIDGEPVILKDRLTVLGVLSYTPLDQSTAVLNLKELIYEKFKGFKKFQIILIAPISAKDDLRKLKEELYSYSELKYWQFAIGDIDSIDQLTKSLLTTTINDFDRFNQVFIIDKNLNQRGRFDDRSKPELKSNAEPYGLYSYDCTKVADLKNKMSEDLRILFTEYRQKRKGTFESDDRRNDNLTTDGREN
jgi:hypothetical protein